MTSTPWLWKRRSVVDCPSQNGVELPGPFSAVASDGKAEQVLDNLLVRCALAG